MTVFDYDPKSGISCGINDYGELFIGGNGSGYNLPNTPENVEYIMADFDTGQNKFKLMCGLMEYIL